jgi:TonB family protein
MKKLILGVCLFCFLPFTYGQSQYQASNDSILSLESTDSLTTSIISKWIQNYMQSNLKYPELAIEHCIEGEVKILVSILQNGEVDTVRVLDGIGFGCDEEVIQLALNMPAWNTATLKEFPRVLKLKMTIHFRLL